MAQIYSVEQVAETLGLSPEGVKNYRKRNPQSFQEGVHFVRDKGAIFYTSVGISEIRKLRGETPGEIEPVSRSELTLQPGSEPTLAAVLELKNSEPLTALVERYRPLLEPLAEAIVAGSLRQEFEDILVQKLLDAQTPMTPQGCAAIFRRNGILPVDFGALPEEEE